MSSFSNKFPLCKGKGLTIQLKMPNSLMKWWVLVGPKNLLNWVDLISCFLIRASWSPPNSTWIGLWVYHYVNMYVGLKMDIGLEPTQASGLLQPWLQVRMFGSPLSSSSITTFLFTMIGRSSWSKKEAWRVVHFPIDVSLCSLTFSRRISVAAKGKKG